MPVEISALIYKTVIFPVDDAYQLIGGLGMNALLDPI
jgi:hypothetical protein